MSLNRIVYQDQVSANRPLRDLAALRMLKWRENWKSRVEEFGAFKVLGLTSESSGTDLDPFVEATDDRVAFLTVDSIVPLKLGVEVFPIILVVDSSSIVAEVESGQAATEQIGNWLNARGSHRQEAMGDPTSF